MPAVESPAMIVSPRVKRNTSRNLVLFCMAIAIPSTQIPPNNDRQNSVVGMSVLTTRVNNPAVLHETAATSTNSTPILSVFGIDSDLRLVGKRVQARGLVKSWKYFRSQILHTEMPPSNGSVSMLIEICLMLVPTA